MLKYSNCVTYIAKKLTLNLPFSLFQFQNKVSVFSNSQGFQFRSQGPLQVVVRKIPSLLETLIISKFRIAFVCCVGFLKITCGENIGCKYWDSSGRWAPQPQSCTVGVWTAPSNEPMLLSISVFWHSTTWYGISYRHTLWKYWTNVKETTVQICQRSYGVGREAHWK